MSQTNMRCEIKEPLRRARISFVLSCLVLAVEAFGPPLVAAPPQEIAVAQPPVGKSIPKEYGREPSSGSAYGNYLAGRAAEFRHDYPAAAKFMARAAETDPPDLAVLTKAMLSRVAEGHVGDAATLARQALELDPRHISATFIAAVHDVANGDPGSALDRLETLASLRPLTADETLVRGWLLIHLGNFDAGLATVSPLNKIKGLVPLYRLQVALMNDVAGYREAAEDLYRDVLLAPGGSAPRSRILAGNFFERIGRRDEATAIYGSMRDTELGDLLAEAALARIAANEVPSPEITDAQAGIAEAMYSIAASLMGRAGSEKTALFYARLALYLRPDSEMGMLLAAELLWDLGVKKEALRIYERIDRQSPSGFLANLRIANEMQAIGREEDAIALLMVLSDSFSGRHEPLLFIGNIRRKQGRLTEAVTSYDAAELRLREAGRKDWRLYFLRGATQDALGAFELAEADLLRALRLEPDQPDVLGFLAQSWLNRGIRLPEARTLLERAIALRPSNGHLIGGLGRAHYQLGDYRRAAALLERAAEMLPLDSQINERLGDAYWRLGRYDAARLQWRRALNQTRGSSAGPLATKIIRGLAVARRAM